MNKAQRQAVGRWQKFYNTMKLGHILLVAILFFACSTTKKSVLFIPTEYTFPENQIGTGKTFIYVDQSNGDSSFYDLCHYQKNNKTYLIRTAYSAKERSDSVIYLNNKLLESYSYMFSKTEATKAVILLDTIINNGRRLGKNILEVNFHTDSTLLSIRSESEFVKDTVFKWQGESLPTLVIKTIYYTSLKSKFNPDVHTDFQLPFLSYEAKKVGTIKIKILKTKDNNTKDIDLIQIKDRST